MASVGISEFSFGYAFLYEQTHANWPMLRAAPILPNLQQEQAQGWDARLPLRGIDFYYQFKLSDYLFNGNAKYIKDGTYDSPYYRLSLHKNDHNRQHQRLRLLSATNRNTFYVAPEFNLIGQFDTAFLNRQITHRSRIIPVRLCRNIDDDDQHHITFQPHSPHWIQHSKAHASEESYFGRDLPKLYTRTKSKWKSIDDRFARNLFSRTRRAVLSLLQNSSFENRQALSLAELASPESTVLPLLDVDPAKEKRDELLVRSSQILSVTFGVTLVLVGSKD